MKYTIITDIEGIDIMASVLQESINTFKESIELLENLRSYQVDALNKVANYLENDSESQFLVKMPMGTGKSVLISILSCLFNKEGTSLVLTPSIPLRDELNKAITEKTWSNLNYIDTEQLKKVKIINSENITKILEDKEPKVLLSTVQMITSLEKDKLMTFDRLKKHIDFVLFDEGHREPAKEWHKVVRGLNKKVVLFTATPTRNDRATFTFNENVYNFTYQQALNESLVREIEFKQESYVNIDNFAKQVKETLISYAKEFHCRRDEVKIIIHCKNSENIREVTKALNNIKLTAVGIHDSFLNEEKNIFFRELRRINDSEQIQCYVHQYKMIEGIDDARFSILYFFDELNNERSIVQQIGRVIRKTKEEQDRKAYVISFSNHEQIAWNNYMRFEATMSNRDLQNFNYQKYHEQFISINPPVIYEKRFLTKYENTLLNEDLNQKLLRYRLPKITNVYQLYEGESLNDAFSQLLCEIDNELLVPEHNLILDKVIDEDKMLAFIIYSTYSINRYLVGEVYMEPRLEIIVLKIIGKTLFIYTSEGLGIELLKNKWKRINATSLLGLFDSNTEFKMATIKNGSISLNHFDRMTVNATDINRMTPDISDRFNFLTVAQGKNDINAKETYNRYVGFTNGRVSQNTEVVLLKEYFHWLDDIALRIETTKTYHELFDRFAPVKNTPEIIDPLTVLFSLEDPLELKDADGNTVELEDYFYLVSNNIIKVKYDNLIYEYSIIFDQMKDQYLLTPVNLMLDTKLFYKGCSLISYINKTQSMHIIVKTREYRYYAGNFYKLGVQSNYNLLQEIGDENKVAIPKNVLINEKGKYFAKIEDAPKKDIWDKNSLFNIVAKKGISIKESSKLKKCLEQADYILCTDLGKEIADFITVSENPKEVCFIHCKAGNSQLSASAFQEVCGQVNKNLDYVHNASDKIPSDLQTLDSHRKVWSVKNYGVSIDRKLVNKNNLKAVEIWAKLKEIQSDPNSTTNVIAFVGDVFDIDRYNKEAKKELQHQSAEKIQIDYLLMETAFAVSRANAKFLLSFTTKDRV